LERVRGVSEEEVEFLEDGGEHELGFLPCERTTLEKRDGLMAGCAET
jgi:hypothetical protein